MPEPGMGLKRTGTDLKQTIRDAQGLTIDGEKHSDTVRGGYDIGAILEAKFYSNDYRGVDPRSDANDPYQILVRDLPLESTPGYLESNEREKTPGTCMWIYEEDEFTSWVDGDRQILWLLGGSGTGKTVLSAHIIDHLRQRGELVKKERPKDASPNGDLSGSHDQPNALVYCFGDAGDSRRSTAGGIVGAILRQLLLHHRKSLHVTDHVLTKNLKVASYNTDMILRTLRDTLKELSEHSRNIFIIIDGLDGCDSSTGKIFIRGLEKLVEHTRTKLLVTIQRVEWIVDELDDIKSIVEILDIGPPMLRSGDIEKMIKDKFLKLHLGKPVGEEIESRLREHIIEHAGETFLWADLVIKSLEATKGQLKGLDFDQILEKCSGSRTLQGAYGRILKDICRRRVEGRLTLDEVEFVLQLVAVAKRPLTAAEIDMAYAVWKRQKRAPAILPDPSKIQKGIYESCIPLVSLNSETKTVALMHKSAAEYLLGGRSYLLLKLVRYLGVILPLVCGPLNEYVVVISLQLVHLISIFSGLGGSFRFHRTSSPTSQLTTRYRRNLTMANSLALEVCLRFLSIQSLEWDGNVATEGGKDPGKDNTDDTVSFVKYVTEYWQDHALAVDPKNAIGHIRKLGQLPKIQRLRDSLLLRAAKHGKTKVLGVLLGEMGANPDVVNNDEMTALQLSAFGGHTDAVQKLIDYGADLDKRDSVGATALHWAAGGAQLETFSQLFGFHQQRKLVGCKNSVKAWLRLVSMPLRSQHGVKDRMDIEMADDAGGTLLAWAVEGGSMKVIEFLLANGARPNVFYCKDIRRYLLGIEGLSEFSQLFEELVELYLGLVRIKWIGRNPLARAAELGQHQIVELLVDHDADPEFEDALHRTPLFWAAKRGDQTGIQILKNRGAKPDSQLRTAVFISETTAVKSLLDFASADPNYIDELGVSVLAYAAVVGERSVMEILLEDPQIDVDVRVTELRITVLGIAAFYGEKVAVKALLQKNANPNIPDVWNITPLNWAARNGFGGIIELFLGSERVNLFVKACTGETALMAAAGTVSEATFKLMMQRDKNLNRLDYFDRSAIFHAVRTRNRPVINLLLSEPSVEAAAVDFYGSTLISVAARFGDNETISKLMQRHSSEMARAQLTMRDNFGRSPITWAASTGHSMTKKVLLGYYKALELLPGGDAFTPVTFMERSAPRGPQPPGSAFCDVCLFNIGDFEPYYTCRKCFAGTYVCCCACWVTLRPRPVCPKKTHVMVLREKVEGDG
ncbi:Ankyrin repeat-containing domain protein [Rhypophila decipiens]